ncbi:General secretion pathway L [Candidatus Magnetobacterium bavaricum]|uniref:General secretion pathway L n=1 Tax=Candidatus Magnetobacterium bavaricum TaxID=29290 RepID=A0A0F3H052_9BACT|nr:General secretion pathway L [Candidatus Magnetobacterium bavaricum]
MKAAFVTPVATGIVVDIFKRKASVYTHEQTILLQTQGDYLKQSRDYVADKGLTSYLSLPAEGLNYRIIEMPFSEKDKILQTLPYALEGLIRGTYDSCVADCIVLGQEAGRFQILVVYIYKVVLQKTLSGLKALGIEPKVVTSLELRYKISKYSVDALYDAVQLSEESRIDMCQEELQLPLINLARGELAYTKDIKKTLRAVRLLLFLMAFAIILSGSHTVYKTYLVNKRVETLKSYMLGSYKKLFTEDTRVVDPLYQLKAKVRKIRQERGFFDAISPLQDLSVLASVNAANIVLLELDMSPAGMTLKGEALGISDVDQYKDKLTTHLSEVSIMETKTGADNKVSFSIHARTGPQGQGKGQEQ